MVWHVAEWAGTVLAAGLVAGVVLAAAAAVGAWLLYRGLRRRVEPLTRAVAGYAGQAAAVTAGVRQGRLPPEVVYHLRRRLGGPPGLE
jgi:membrane protein implicated in regulation of membrane protease activity